MTELAISPSDHSAPPVGGGTGTSTAPNAKTWRNRLAPLFAFGSFELGRLVRSWKFLTITIGFPVVFYLLFLGDRPAGEIVDGSVTWRVYLMVSMCSFGALVAALNAGGTRLSMERASGWARQLRITPIPSWSYVGTKIVTGMLVVLPVIALVEVVGAGFGGVSMSAGSWIGLTMLLWVTSLTYVVLGVFVGFVVTTEAAFPVVTALMFILGYFGGLFTPVDRMPNALQHIAHVMPSYHQTSLAVAYLAGQSLAPSHWLVLAGYVVMLGLGIVWKHRVEEARGLA